MSDSKPIFKNIGHMWHRKFVDWETISLIGYKEGENSRKVDFAYQAGIYALYDRNCQCVYVGQAGRGEHNGFFHRLQSHAINDELFCMWERFSWYGLYSITTLTSTAEACFEKELDPGFRTDYNEIMNVMESMIIRVHIPKFNLSKGSLKKNTNSENIEWYYQKAEQEERILKFKELTEKCPSLKKMPIT